LAVTPGAEITIRAEGDDEAEAVDALASLIGSRFGESEIRPV
jgi:phosphotransferase system HPr-like phosphotransfer protein